MFAQSSRTMAGAKRLAETRRPDRSREEVTVCVRRVHWEGLPPAKVVRVINPIPRAAKAKLVAERPNAWRYRPRPVWTPLRCPPDAPRSKRILYRVCNAWRVPPEAILGKDRRQPYAVARQAYCYWLRRLMKLTLHQIGRMLGGLDHTSILLASRAYPANREKHRSKIGKSMGGER